MPNEHSPQQFVAKWRDVELDKAVLDAYGWLPSGDISDEEILGRLLALNLERAGG